MEINYRILNKNDVTKYKEIRLELLKGYPMNFGSSFEEENSFSEEVWMNRVDKSTVKTIGAFDGEKLIGICVVAFSPRVKMKHIANIHSMYVKEEYRNRNIGYALINMAFNLCKEKDVEIVRLSVVDGNESAINLYKKLGFTQYGIEKKTIKYNEIYYDLVLMSTDIKK